MFLGHPLRRWGRWSGAVGCGIAKVVGVEGLGGDAREVAVGGGGACSRGPVGQCPCSW
jgi:hypothetical protein